MPKKFQNVRQNFSKGVVTPRLSARVDLEGFKNALLTGKNWIITSQGGAMMREGMQYVGDPASDSKFRIFQFFRGGEIADILVEVTAGKIRFWIDNGTPTVYQFEGTDVELDAPYGEADLDDLYFINQDKFGVILSGNHPPFYITFRADGSVIGELFPLSRVPDYDYNDLNSPKQEITSRVFEINFYSGWQTSTFVYEAVYGFTSSRLSYAYNPNDPEVNRANIDRMLELSADRQGSDASFVVEIVTEDGQPYPTGTAVPGSYRVTVTGTGVYLRVGILPIDDRDTGRFGGGLSPIGIDPSTQPVWEEP